MVKKVIITWQFGDDYDHVEFIRGMFDRADAEVIESVMVGGGNVMVESEDFDLIENASDDEDESM